MSFDLTTVDRIASLRRDTIRKFRQVGLLRTLDHGARKFVRDLKNSLTSHPASRVDPFDLKHGTDTARIVSVGALDIRDNDLEHSNRYEAVVPLVFNRIMVELPIRHQDFTFVDIGCGKGRALLLASTFAFRKIVGIDISQQLIDIALHNIAVYHDGVMRCRDIEARCVDGRNFVPPPGDLVLYLNNPFDEQVMAALVDSVEQSLQVDQRKLFVVYQRPMHRAPWDRSTAFRQVHSSTRYVVYENIGS